MWYDLASFPHPGGPVALRLAKGRDATALFEAHHHLLPAPAAARILAPYRCCERLQGELEAAEGGGHYEWEGFAADEFVKGVRSMLRAHFGAEARRRGVSISDAMKATPRRRLLVLLLSLSFLLSLPALLGGRWWALLATPQLAWLCVANYWHDALHFALDGDWRVNALAPYLFPWLSSPWMW